MKKREVGLDLLRIISLTAVVIVHVCGTIIPKMPVTDVRWQTASFIRGILTWQVPCFVMISGRFFLDPAREVDTRKIRKAVIRLICAFLFWNLLYQLFYYFSGAYSNLNWNGILSEAVHGAYHFWYIYMLLGLYILVPILRNLVRNRTATRYFLLLFLLFSLLNGYMDKLPLIGTTIRQVLDMVNFHHAVGFVGYFVLGYYLHEYPVSDRWKKWVYILGAVLIVAAGAGNVLAARYTGEENTIFVRYLMPNIIVESACVYTFFIKEISRIRFSQKLERWIIKLSDLSFGVFLNHALVLELLSAVGFSLTSGPLVVMVMACTLIVLTVGNAVAALIRRLPKIGLLLS